MVGIKVKFLFKRFSWVLDGLKFFVNIIILGDKRGFDFLIFFFIGFMGIVSLNSLVSGEILFESCFLFNVFGFFSFGN